MLKMHKTFSKKNIYYKTYIYGNKPSQFIEKKRNIFASTFNKLN